MHAFQGLLHYSSLAVFLSLRTGIGKLDFIMRLNTTCAVFALRARRQRQSSYRTSLNSFGNKEDFDNCQVNGIRRIKKPGLKQANTSMSVPPLASYK